MSLEAEGARSLRVEAEHHELKDLSRDFQRSLRASLEEALAAVALTERAWPTIAVRKVIAADMFAELLR